MVLSIIIQATCSVLQHRTFSYTSEVSHALFRPFSHLYKDRTRMEEQILKDSNYKIEVAKELNDQSWLFPGNPKTYF